MIDNIHPIGLCVVVARYHWIKDGDGFFTFASHGLLELLPDPNLVGPGVKNVAEAEPEGNGDEGCPSWGYDFTDVVPSTSRDFQKRIGAVERIPIPRQGNQVISDRHWRPCGCVAKDVQKLADAFNAKHYQYDPVPNSLESIVANSNTYFFEELAFEENKSDPVVPTDSTTPFDGPVVAPGYYHAPGFHVFY